MIRAGLWLGLLGLVAASALVIYQGAGPVLATFASAGWGLLWVALYHSVPMLANARAWQVLLPGRVQPSFGFFAWMVWVREAVNAMLPVARIGGEVTGAWLLTKRGVRKRPAAATLVVDMTMSLVSQLAFTLIGMVLLVTRGGEQSLAVSVGLGLLVTLPIVAAFGLVQRIGIFGVFARLFHLVFGDRFDRMVGGAKALDRAVYVIYRRPGRVLACALWQLVGWVLSAGETWIALFALGHPAGVGDAIMVTALIEAASSSAFLVPGALGVQEGSFLVLGGVLGLPPEVSLALALVRRARDVLVYGPALALWQLGEGRRLLIRSSEAVR
ncbi:MAG TPA: lysylphosphatidylglycerol synthase domain-containing protein [Stellaceae bacterium]|nr:lysylphosphatidylglycerol synthase domain-containing protein [Stellaceae bacterium]